MWIKVILILLIASAAFAEPVPIGFSKWRHSENVESFALGGAPQNYQKDDDSWDRIDNDFIVDADSAYCHTAILKITVGNNGESTVRLKWNGVTYEITREPKKIVWYNSRTKQWVDVIPNLSWPTSTIIDGNTIEWGFPGFSYSIIIGEATTEISHRFTLRDPFLDSANVLFDLLPDSVKPYIYLATVMEYSFVNIDDSTLLDIPDVDMKSLIRIGKTIFDISKQNVQYDGWELYDPIPVGQRWKKQAGKIYCAEVMNWQKIKELTELFPDIPIWHDAQDSFSIDSTTTGVDMAELYSFSGGNDQYGARVTANCGLPFGTRINRFPIQFVNLRDSMAAVGAATWDSGRVFINVQVATGLGAGTSVPDTLWISLHKITTLWDEGESDGLNQGAGVRWDSASASGSGGGGSNPNAPLDWTDGGDFESDSEYGDTTIYAGGEVSNNDTLSYKIEGTTIADTTNDFGYMVYNAYAADGDDGGNAAVLTFDSDDAADANSRPYLEVFYTTGAAPAAYPMRRRHIIQKLQGDS